MYWYECKPVLLGQELLQLHQHSGLDRVAQELEENGGIGYQVGQLDFQQVYRCAVNMDIE